MKRLSRRVFPLAVLAGTLAAVGGFSIFSSRGASASTGVSSSAAAHRCVSIPGAGDTTFTRNFNPFGGANDAALTKGAIYDTLMVMTTAGGGHTYPMLATSYTWSKDVKTMYVQLRHGVEWSDGKPFTSADVVYTFVGAASQNKAWDQLGITGPTSPFTSINAVGPFEIAVHFKQPDVPAGLDLLSQHWIIPKHIWANVTDPSTFTNPDPVGTGPFTQVEQFSGQQFTLGKNPHFWVPGEPRIACVTRISTSSNDAALLTMESGEVDWAGIFVPNIQNAYVAHDPAHYHYFFAANADAQGLYFDTTKYPWGLPGFRKAISMAIDRSKISNIGESGYGPPAGPLGIEGEYPKWIPPKLEQAAKKLVTYNPAAAKAALQQLGFTYNGSTLIDPHGNPVTFNMDVISGWSDWVLDNQIIQTDLQAIGIQVNLQLSPDFPSWSALADKALVLSMHWPCGAGPTPYWDFWNLLSTQSKAQAPVGAEPTGGCNWGRLGDAKATKLIDEMRRTPSTTGQMKLAAQIEALQIKDFPFVPLYVGPWWFEYSTKYFTNWPTQKNTYANGAPYVYPDNGVVLATLEYAK